MILEFIGNAPRMSYIRIGVNGNNLVDDLVFILGRKQGKNDLYEFTPKIKITTPERDFAEYSGDDLTVEKIEERDTIKITYVLPEIVTERGNVDMLIVFEKTIDGGAVKTWQTLPFNVTFPDGIDESDSLIEAYPNIVRELKADTKKAVDDSAAAVSTANAAKNTADTAKSTADNAKKASSEAVATANAAKSTADSVTAAEANRASAETARAAAEGDRVAAENARKTAESARASAESARVSAESARVEAENKRVSAESARVSAESERAKSETARKTAESARATAEANRASAEIARAAAEGDRVADYNALKADLKATAGETAASVAASVANETVDKRMDEIELEFADASLSKLGMGIRLFYDDDGYPCYEDTE